MVHEGASGPRAGAGVVGAMDCGGGGDSSTSWGRSVARRWDSGAGSRWGDEGVGGLGGLGGVPAVLTINTSESFFPPSTYTSMIEEIGHCSRKPTGT